MLSLDPTNQDNKKLLKDKVNNKTYIRGIHNLIIQVNYQELEDSQRHIKLSIKTIIDSMQQKSYQKNPLIKKDKDINCSFKLKFIKDSNINISYNLFKLLKINKIFISFCSIVETIL